MSAAAAARNAAFSAAASVPHVTPNASPDGVYGTVPPGSHAVRNDCSDAFAITFLV